MKSHTPTSVSSADLSNWEIAKRLLRFSWQFRNQCMVVLTLQILLLLLTLSGLTLTGLGVDTLRQHIQANAPAPHWPLGITPPATASPMSILLGIAVAILLLAIVRSVMNYAYTVLMAKLVQVEIVVNMRAAVYEKMLQLSFRFFDANASSSIINRVTGDVQMLRQFVDGVIIQGLILTLSLAVYVGFMIHVAPELTLACLITTPIMAFLVVNFSRRIRPDYQTNRQLNDQMIATLAENVQGIQVIKGFAQEQQSEEQFRQRNVRVKDQQQRIFWRLSCFNPLMGFLTQANMIIVLGYGGMLVIRNELPLGAGLMVFAGLVQQFATQIANLANISNSVQQSLIGARRVFEILDAPIEIASGDGRLLDKVRGEIRFEQVSFFYKENTPTLSQIDFTAAAGQCVALLGPLGSGKSTLMSLIPRFYDPTGGRILLDGRDLRDLSVQDLRRHIGVVFQENFLFSATVSENIAFGHPHATKDQIEHAARIAAAHEFILQLPKGYDTILGEYGVNLSGGQRQRLAIARAILLDPAILLLDDPTAAVDAETEHEIIEALLSAIKGRTAFISTHRLSTIAYANTILVLKDGRIVQKGTHADLRSKAGYYKFVADLQLVDDTTDSGEAVHS